VNAPAHGLGRLGVWVPMPVSAEDAAAIEKLGYSAIWVGSSPAAELAFVEPILAATRSLVVATGIVNIWSAPARIVAESFHRIEKSYPGRFVLGIGVGHREHTADYRTPFDALTEYLDELDAAGVPQQRRIIAAMGPRMLTMTAQRSAGTHPAWTPPSYNESARQILGADRVLAPIQSIVLTDDAVAARAVGRQLLQVYLGLSNYVSNWRRLGFTDDDFADAGSDHLVDALLAHGGPDEIADRIKKHFAHGADHVALGILTSPHELLDRLADLAGPLGLTPG